jgi:ribose transport system ATP-binding protein
MVAVAPPDGCRMSTGSMGGTAVFAARGITKAYPGVLALDDVSLTLRAGSIHALLGENGAGKSTLIKIITGVQRADRGSLMLRGEAIAPASIHDAKALGIAVLHQERHLLARLSIAENIMLDRLAGFDLSPIDYRAIEAEARRWLQVLDLDLDPGLPVGRLAVAQVQLVEIAKALSQRSSVLLLDEPTTALTPHETAQFFALMRRLRDQGVSIVFVSHKLEEVLELCDAVTVLRDGRNACESRPLAGLGRADLVRLMIGRAEAPVHWQGSTRRRGAPALALSGVGSALGHRDVTLTLHRGEILGLYGLVGAGRTELARVILGEAALTAGQIAVAGAPARITGVRIARDRYRIGYVSEDRKSLGLILSHSVLDNAGITIWRRLAGWAGFLTQRRVAARVGPVLDRLEVKTPSLAQRVGNLSGGNQQKVSVAKWLAAGVDVLIVDEPTVGIDIKTKASLHRILRDLAAEAGTAILLITSDMPEMIALADRIAVMHGYRIIGEVANDGNAERVGRAIMDCIHRLDAKAPGEPA